VHSPPQVFFSFFSAFLGCWNSAHCFFSPPPVNLRVLFFSKKGFSYPLDAVPASEKGSFPSAKGWVFFSPPPPFLNHSSYSGMFPSFFSGDKRRSPPFFFFFLHLDCGVSRQPENSRFPFFCVLSSGKGRGVVKACSFFPFCSDRKGSNFSFVSQRIEGAVPPPVIFQWIGFSFSPVGGPFFASVFADCSFFPPPLRPRGLLFTGKPRHSAALAFFWSSPLGGRGFLAARCALVRFFGAGKNIVISQILPFSPIFQNLYDAPLVRNWICSAVTFFPFSILPRVFWSP